MYIKRERKGERERGERKIKREGKREREKEKINVQNDLPNGGYSKLCPEQHHEHLTLPC